MRGRISSALVLHPVFLAALALLILNDRVLKQAYSNWTTGKLSDFAGLVVFPLMVLSVADLILGHERVLRLATGVFIASGVAFSAIQTNPFAADLYRALLPVIQSPLPLFGGSAIASAHVADPSDLLAVPALLLAFCIARPHLEIATDVPRHNPIGTMSPSLGAGPGRRLRGERLPAAAGGTSWPSRRTCTDSMPLR